MTFNQEGQSVEVQFNQSNQSDIDDRLIEIEYNLRKAKLRINRNDIKEALYYINNALKMCSK